VLKNDFILRIIEELVAALRRVMKLREEERDAEALVELDRLSKSVTGLGADALLLTHSLRSMLPEPERLAVVARLLKEYGEVRKEPHVRMQAFRKAFAIYDLLDQKGALTDEHGHREAFAQLVERLSQPS
jgi:hypothetical protein